MSTVAFCWSAGRCSQVWQQPGMHPCAPPPVGWVRRDADGCPGMALRPGGGAHLQRACYNQPFLSAGLSADSRSVATCPSKCQWRAAPPASCVHGGRLPAHAPRSEQPTWPPTPHAARPRHTPAAVTGTAGATSSASPQPEASGHCRGCRGLLLSSTCPPADQNILEHSARCLEPPGGAPL